MKVRKYQLIDDITLDHGVPSWVSSSLIQSENHAGVMLDWVDYLLHLLERSGDI